MDRLSRQSGKDRSCLRRMVITNIQVPTIRRELAISGISELLIFPELSGLCRKIKAGFFGA
ncbi:MAG: hypothetical protein L3J18_02585 [Candidatus Brocadia sp.]|nr:MAG: hypothetical protein L3J18_02585 [Candidatus Brocadia sp.]